MKNLLIVSSDKLVLETLLPLIDQGRIYTYRVVATIEQLYDLLAYEKDFFISLVDAQLDDKGTFKMINAVLRHKIPVIALIETFEDGIIKRLSAFPIVDYISKENREHIKRAMTLCEDLINYKNKKALVLHSNKTIEMYLMDYLKLIFFDPVAVRSMNEAKELLCSDTTYSMLLVNHEHADMKGYEFVKLIRDDPVISKHPLHKDIIIIGITSSDADFIKSSFLKNGANDILKIPFVKEEFNTKISNIMRHTTQTRVLRTKMDLIDAYVISTQTDIYGVITDVSQAFERISGFLKEELVGNPHSKVSHPDRDRSIFADLWRTIKQGHVWQGEIKNRTKDGGTFWLRINISPDFVEGAVVGYTAISDDITAQKNLEELSKSLEDRIVLALEENKRQSDQMIQQSRLAQMGEMISMIAHQWRQPLTSITAICGNMTMDLLMNQYDPQTFNKHLENITNISLHLSSTINDFRGFFKENKESTPVTWRELVDECLTIIGPTLHASSITVIKIYEAETLIDTFPNEVKQVIINILKNSKDVLTERAISDPTITLRSFEEEGQSILQIEDSGGGIAEEIIGKIFDPYFTTKDEYNGTGVGLYMSKTIIQEHCKGSLEVCNTPKGASFNIVLPLNHEQE